MDYINSARLVLDTEAKAISALSESLDQKAFSDAVDAILNCKGRVIVSGMGKSGHIAGKIAATLASTGTPAFFVHPAEAAHGDLGMILEGDIVLALSNSGESNELLSILPALKHKNIKIISICSRPKSHLAQQSDIFLNTDITEEACPLGLAPTTSTTVALALGDALSVALLEARNFTHEDFARSHPAGSLGKRLLLKVSDIMLTGDDIPVVTPQTQLQDAIVEMSKKRMGMVLVKDNNTLAGIFTDGDLRRLFQTQKTFDNLIINEIMTKNPHTIDEKSLAIEALDKMKKHSINALAVLDVSGSLKGAVSMHDLLQSGIA